MTAVRFKRMMSRNWVTKVACLVLAFVVWQGIRENTSFETVMTDVSVRVVTAEGWAVLEQSADAVSVGFRGSRDDIKYLNSDQVEIVIELPENSGAAERSIRLLPRHVKASSRARAVAVTPEQLFVTVGREVERQIPVKVSFEGALPEGIDLEKTVAEPATVKIRGAAQRVGKLEHVRTEPVSLDGRVHSFKTHVSVATAGAAWQVTPERVLAEIVLIERTTTREFSDIYVRPLLLPGEARRIEIRPAKIRVVLKGSDQRMEPLKARDLYVYVDCSELTESAQYELPVRVDVPFGLQVERIEPAVVNITVSNR